MVLWVIVFDIWVRKESEERDVKLIVTVGIFEDAKARIRMRGVLTNTSSSSLADEMEISLS